MQASIVIPTYNEEQSIGEVLESIVQIMGQSDIAHEIIVVDDGSEDKTADIARRKGVRLIQHALNKGYGAALKTGIRHARYDIVVTIDADGTYCSQDILRLLTEMAQSDMVVGARVGKEVKVPALRRPAKWLLTQLANYLTGTTIPDLNSGLRAFRKEAAIEFFRILPAGFSFSTTITLAMLSNDYIVKYIPISYGERIGKSKIKPLHDTANFLQLIVRTAMYFAPLKVFLPISLALFIIGVIVAAYSVLVLRKIMDVTVMVTMLAALQIAITGLLADLIDKRNPRL